MTYGWLRQNCLFFSEKLRTGGYSRITDGSFFHSSFPYEFLHPKTTNDPYQTPKEPAQRHYPDQITFPFFLQPRVYLLLSLLLLLLGSLLLLPLPDKGLAVVFTVGETVNGVNVALGWGGVGEEDTAVEVKLDGLGQL